MIRMKSEIWKDIPGFEGRYQVSDQGRVKSLRHPVQISPGKDGRKGYVKYVSERILSPGTGGNPGAGKHASVSFSLKGRTYSVHQLVMLAFVGPRPEGMEVCHSNGNGLDNRLENLRYDTRVENCRDIFRCEVRKNQLPIAVVKEIKQLIADGWRNIDISRKLDVNKDIVSDIRTGRSYNYI